MITSSTVAKIESNVSVYGSTEWTIFVIVTCRPTSTSSVYVINSINFCTFFIVKFIAAVAQSYSISLTWVRHSILYYSSRWPNMFHAILFAPNRKSITHMNKSVDSTPAFAGFSRFQIFLGGFLLSRTCQTRENTLPQTQSTESRRRTTTEKNTWLDRQKSIDGPDVVRYRWKSDFYLITRCILAVNCRQNLYSRTINSRCPIKSSSWSSTTRPQPHTHAHSQTTPRHTHTDKQYPVTIGERKNHPNFTCTTRN